MVKIYWTSEEDRKKVRRELTKDEKDIAFTWGMVGYVLGILSTIIFCDLVIHLIWV